MVLSFVIICFSLVILLFVVLVGVCLVLVLFLVVLIILMFLVIWLVVMVLLLLIGLLEILLVIFVLIMCNVGVRINWLEVGVGFEFVLILGVVELLCIFGCVYLLFEIR